jgi:glycosyltransferase involved in cell wall biosynthesis
MSERRVLLISQVFYPDEVAVASLFTKLCAELVKSGMKIEVWCAQPSYTTTIRQPRYRFYEGIDIHYLRSSNYHKDKFIGRLINFLTFTLSVVAKLTISREKTQVISHTTPPFLAIIIAFMCSIRKRHFIYILMDVFPDGLIRLKRASSRNFIIQIWSSLHLAALKRCKKIIVIGRDMEIWLRDFYLTGGEKIQYIPLWQDDELIQQVDFENNPFIISNQLQNHFIVQYSGNMGLWNEMEVIGRAVNKKPEGVMFVFIGGGMRKKELLKSFKESSPGNVMFFPFQSEDKYSYSVSACHAALVTLCDGIQGMAVPSKIIGIMAAGIPVIAMAPANSEIAYIVSEENCGYVLSPSDSAGLINAITELKSDENLRRSLGQNGRIAFEKKYTTKIISEQYSILLTN